MIVVLEHDRRFGWSWCPRWFRYPWRWGWSNRFMFGWWSITFVPEKGLKEYLDHIRGGNTEWKDA